MTILLSSFFTSCKNDDDNIEVVNIKFTLSVIYDDYNVFDANYINLSEIKVAGSTWYPGDGEELYPIVYFRQTTDVPMEAVAGSSGVNVEVTAQAWGTENSTYTSISGVKDGDVINLNVCTSEYSITNNGSGGSDASIVGKWMQTNSCSNVDGISNTWEFFSNGTCKFFAADCNSVCAGYGFFIDLDWSVSGSSLTTQQTAVGTYCGNTVPPKADPVTDSYSIDGNILTLNGNTFEKQ